MAILLLPRRSVTLPSTGAVLREPYARGLVAAVAPGVGNAGLVDLVSGLPLALAGGAVLGTAGGTAGLICGAGASASVLCPPALKIAAPLFMIARMSFFGVPTVGALICGVTANNTGASPFLAYAFDIDASGLLRLGYSNGAAFLQFTGGVGYQRAPTIGRPFTMGGLFTTGSGTTIYFGPDIGVTGAGAAAPSYSGTSMLQIGAGVAGTTNACVEYVLIFNQRIAPAEIQRFRDDPYHWLRLAAARQFALGAAPTPTVGPWDLTIAGVSQKAKGLVTGGLSIRLESSERSTLRCTLRRVGGYMPARFDPVLVTDNSGALMFGGIILSREVDAEVPALETVTISCVDWWVYLDWALVTLTYTAPVTTKTILTALVAALPASYGFTVSASQVNGFTYQTYSSGDNVKASEVLRGLARDLGYRPDVSPAKVLAVVAPGTTTAPFSITTAAPHCQAARWLDPTGTPANRIVLRCGPAGVGEFIAYNWVGDGVKRVFALKGVAVPSSSVWPGVCFVGGVQLPVWLPGEGPPDHIEWNYALNDGTLTFIGGGTSSPPGVGVDVELRYAPQFPFTVIASSGATPEISEIFTDETIIVYEQGVTRAAALLAERNQPAARELAVSSQADGWRPDQVVAVNLSQLSFVGNCTIGAVDIRLQLDDLWLYQFTAPETTIVPGSALDIWRKLIGGSSGSSTSSTAIGGSGGGFTQLTGDVTAGPGTGAAVATIANEAVTYAKVQNVSGASKLLGRGAATGAGDVEELTLGTGLSMTGTTVNGPRNSALVNYTYNTGAEPPNAGQIRMDFGFPWTATTKLWVRFVSVDDQDVYWGIMILSIGSAILVQDKDVHTSYARFVTTGAPIDKGLYAEIPVAWVANGSSIISGQQVLLQATAVSAVVQRRQVLVVIDGGGAVIATGVQTFVSLPVGGTWKKWRIVSIDSAATAGSIVIDVWRDTFANYPPTVADTITASAKPTLSAASKAESSTLTGWTTAFAAGDVLGFKVDSATTVTKVQLVLEFE